MVRKTKSKKSLISMTGKAKKAFKKFSYRGVDLKNLFDLSNEQLVKLLNARARRRFTVRGLKRKPLAFLKKLRKAKKEAGAEGAKPEIVKTHLRDMIIIPEMIGSVVGVYNGKSFTAVDIKPEMLNHYLGEFSITYKPVGHGRAGAMMGANARYTPL